MADGFVENILKALKDEKTLGVFIQNNFGDDTADAIKKIAFAVDGTYWEAYNLEEGKVYLDRKILFIDAVGSEKETCKDTVRRIVFVRAHAGKITVLITPMTGAELIQRYGSAWSRAVNSFVKFSLQEKK